jgi:uncharacterized protein (DUF2236 family)
LQRRLEATAREFLQAGAQSTVDFSQPAGEPALTSADSVSWLVFKNPVSLFIGGVVAVLLELAEPRVRTGVWEHTGFQRDPRRRLQRTGLAAMMTVYGPRSRAEEMIAGVRRAHERVNGTTSDGQPYRANDPELLCWVHATASFGFLEAYARWVRPLAGSERDRYYTEGLASARLYGATGAPVSEADILALFDTMRDKLEPSPIIFEFLDIMRSVRLLPRPFAPVQMLLLKGAVDLLPGWLRARLGLDTSGWVLRPWERKLIHAIATLADRILLRSAPAVQSCRRLGLPDDYLY